VTEISVVKGVGVEGGSVGVEPPKGVKLGTTLLDASWSAAIGVPVTPVGNAKVGATYSFPAMAIVGSGVAFKPKPAASNVGHEFELSAVANCVGTTEIVSGAGRAFIHNKNTNPPTASRKINAERQPLPDYA
jgi:hypothetical protein